MKIKINNGEFDFNSDVIKRIRVYNTKNHWFINNAIFNVNNYKKNAVYLYKELYFKIIKMMITGNTLTYYIVYDLLNMIFNE